MSGGHFLLLCWQFHTWQSATGLVGKERGQGFAGGQLVQATETPDSTPQASLGSEDSSQSTGALGNSSSLGAVTSAFMMTPAIAPATSSKATRPTAMSSSAPPRRFRRKQPRPVRGTRHSTFQPDLPLPSIEQSDEEEQSEEDEVVEIKEAEGTDGTGVE